MHDQIRRPARLAAWIGCTFLFCGFITRTSLPEPPSESPLIADLGKDYVKFSPPEHQSKVTDEILDELKDSHYIHVDVDDRLSEKLFESYLDVLDRTRSFFLEADIRGFEVHRRKLDDALRGGDLEPAYEIFNLLQARRFERQHVLISQLEAGISNLRFDIDESLSFDRKEGPWLKDKEEARDLWRRQFKSHVLNLKLTDKSDEKIVEILTKRYSDQFHRMKQTLPRDVFLTFITSFTQIYDPHTEYFPPRVAENFDIRMSLSLEGIGAILQNEGEYTKVVRLIPGGPAQAGGKLKPTDRIIGVAQENDDEVTDVTGWRIDEVVDLIRGPKGTVVRLQILSAGVSSSADSKFIRITRDQVKLEEQAASKKIIELERGDRKFRVGIIDLPDFYMDFEAARKRDPDYRSASRDVLRLIGELKAEKIDGLVMDLRNNGGGSLLEAQLVTGLFLRTGPVVQIRNADGRIQVLNDENPVVAYSGPLAVLVNRLSASASEIFAAAIQDYERGIVVGGRTFGKGTVQNIRELDEGQIKLTLAKFYRVEGGSTQNRGVVPDIDFPDYYDEEEIGESALPAAMEWDSIRTLPIRKPQHIRGTLPELRRLHESRTANDAEFQAIEDRMAYRRSRRNVNTLSLNFEVRKRERAEAEAQLLEIENKRRIGKGLEPVEKLDEIASESDEGAEDPLLVESANILFDAATLPY